ncbi:hypothetical protein [Mycobacterium sp. E2733]|uniref:hypothetical protein n=1 Tax=Mycobacterium sp. E2733 TaxID=1834138 RepID=UPI0012EA8433|nr:hypothetical protein [Mycobacterium sp. E2733]
MSDDELRELIAKSAPDVLIEDTRRQTKEPPPGIRSLPDRKTLAEKVARYRGLDASAVVEPQPLSEDQSQFVDLTVRTAEGTLRKAAMVSTETGEIIAEQG